MEEKAETSKAAAPHAGISGVGYIDQPWDPTELAKKAEDNARRLEEIGMIGSMDPIKKLKKADMLPDFSLTGAKRGKDKIGGMLTPLGTKAIQSSVRLPLKPTNDTGNELQFKLNRKKSALSQRLGQITELRESLAKEVALLDAARRASRQTSRGRTASGASDILSDKANVLMSSTVPMNPSVVPVGAGKDAAKMLSRSAPLVKGISADVGAKQDSDIQQKSFSEPHNDSDFEDATNLSDEDYSVEEDTSHIPPELKEEIRKLEDERAVLTQEYNRVVRKENMLLKLKENQRLTTEQERSRDIERKRRLLNAEEGRRRGPPPADELDSVYDYFAVIAQTTVRGWLARRWYTFYRGAVIKASILLQKMVRGWMARTRIGRLMVQSRACRLIQRIFRGFKARVSIFIRFIYERFFCFVLYFA
jgi:hypothetical protein